MPIPTMWPVDVPAGQRFGDNKAPYQPDGHTGIDFPCPVGTPLRAAAAGTVLYADWAQGLGWPNPYYIAIDFDGPANGDQSAGIVVVIDHGPFITICAHMNQTGLNPGDQVAMGELIGQTGNTGRSTGPHVHFEVLPDGWNVNGPFYGRVDPALYIGLPSALAPNERIVGPQGMNGRSAPQVTPDNITRPGVPGGTKEVMDGWINGQVISGIGVWYHDRDNIWYWSGAFESQDTAGLADLNTIAVQGDVKPALQPNERETAAQVIRRSLPDKNSAQLETFAPDLVLTFKGYVRGTDPYGPSQGSKGNNVWFVGAFGTPTYFWSGGFKDTGTHDLPDLTAPEPVPGPGTPTPAVPAYAFDLDFLAVNGISVEYFPAHIGNVDVGNFPADPSTAVCHWWNSLDLHPVISGVIGEFQREGAFKSAHFLVTSGRIIQMVSLKDRAYHAGPGGNGWVGIEIDPVATAKNQDGTWTAEALKVQANVRALLALLRDRKGYKFATVLHKNVPGNNTSCSDLDLTTFEIDPPVVIPPVVVTPPPVVVSPAGLTPEQLAILASFAGYLGSLKG